MVWHYQPACDSPWIVWKRKGTGAEDRPVCHGLQPELQTFLLASDCRVNSGEDPPSVRIYFWDRTLVLIFVAETAAFGSGRSEAGRPPAAIEDQGPRAGHESRTEGQSLADLARAVARPG